MSIDLLHEKIRKLKNPVIVDFGLRETMIPKHLLKEEGSLAGAYDRFCKEMLDRLKGAAAGVRFSFDDFALLSKDGTAMLQKILKQAGELGFYVILECPQILTPSAADRAAETIFGSDAYPCDAVLLSPYIGSDALKPFVAFCAGGSKTAFVVVRSPNKSAHELQDLLTGKRLVHGAAAEMVNRYGSQIITKCGYSTVASTVSAGFPEGVRMLREQHKHMFLLVDGIDYPSGNAKNCSYAFDRFGYGGAVSVGTTVTAAWKDAEGSDGTDYVQHALQAVERIRKNILRYVTIL